MDRVNLTPAQVAERLHVTRATLANWRSQGGGPEYIKFGRTVLYPLAILENWEKSRLRKATSVPVVP